MPLVALLNAVQRLSDLKKKNNFCGQENILKKVSHEGPTPPLNTTESTAHSSVISELYRQNNNDPVWSIWTLPWMDSHLISIACIRITWFQYRQFFNNYNFTWKRYNWSIPSLNKHRKKKITIPHTSKQKKFKINLKNRKFCVSWWYNVVFRLPEAIRQNAHFTSTFHVFQGIKRLSAYKWVINCVHSGGMN